MRSCPLAVATRDFSAFHDLVAALRERGLLHQVVEPDRPLPLRVRVVITTPGDLPLVQPHAHAIGAAVVVHSVSDRTVANAVQALLGKGRFTRVVVGIDPGERPGVAVIGDGVLVATAHAASPEAAAEEAQRAVEDVPADGYVVRVGHGAPTMRDRILVALAARPALAHARVEVVDETDSTPQRYSSPAERDTTAAASIALATGSPVVSVAEPVPSEGEVRDIQRKSRLASVGELTISRALAHAVAVGDMTLDEALHAQRGKRAVP